MKADELWEKYGNEVLFGADMQVSEDAFRAALTEYGEHARSAAVKVCREVATERMPAATKGFCITNDGLGCAAAIEKMPLP